MTDSIKSVIPPRIFLSCVPRSCSSVFTKFMTYVDGAEIWFEPYVLSHLRELNWYESMIENKEVSRALKRTLNEVTSSITKRDMGNTKEFERYSYESTKAELEGEPLNTDAKFIFIKDMAFAIDGFYQFIPDKVPCKHVFLIRHPHRFLSSYHKHVQRLMGVSSEEYNHGASDLLIRGGKCNDQIFELWKYIREKVDPNPVVLDTDDMLENPEKVLPKLFEQLHIPWKDSYLVWPGDSSCPKSWIACCEAFDDKIARGSFDRAFNSTCFIPLKDPVPTRQDVNPAIAKYIDKYMPGYEEMHKYAISK